MMLASFGAIPSENAAIFPAQETGKNLHLGEYF